MSKNLPTDAKVKLLEKAVDDYLFYLDSGTKNCPRNQTFRISSRDEARDVQRSARLSAFASIEKPIIKQAFDNKIIKQSFDTRKTNQITDRNPRRNLQYWQRTDEFITEEDNKKLKVFARLKKVLDKIKEDYGEQPEWFDSYAYQLHDSANRVLMIKDSDVEVFRPQMNYLEQLISARYHLTMEDITKMGTKSLYDKILSKDEPLMKRGYFIKETGGLEKKTQELVIDGKESTQKAIVDAIFGNTGFRRDGEKTVERVITISIKDSVIE